MSILLENFEIKFNDKSLDNYVIIDVELFKCLQSPNELKFSMSKKSLIKSNDDISYTIFKELLGAKVKLSLTTSRRNENFETKNERLSFEGIVFNVNTSQSSMNKEIIINVVAYSPDYFLYDNAHCYSFNDCTLNTIVTKAISDYDIKTEISPKMNSAIHYVVQYNETTYHFLSRLAQRYGEFLYYEDGKMVFGKINEKETVSLYPEIDILGYHYELDMKHTKFSHGMHDYLKHENSKGKATDFSVNSISTLNDYSYKRAGDIYKKETFQNLHAATQEENKITQLNESLKSQGLSNKTQMMICHATTNRADLKIGSKIIIQEFFDIEGKTENKKHEELVICQISHHMNLNGGYENHIMAIPAKATYPLYSNTDVYPIAESQRAVVKDNKDPEKLGRVKVQFLWQELQDQSLITPWIRLTQSHGGDNKGFYFIPEIGEEVMVGFENGNAEKPYVLGTLFHGNQHPEGKWYSDADDIKAIRTRSGHTIEFYDTNGKEYIRIYDNEKENYILTYSTYEKLIKLESKGNIELYADENIIMHAKKNIEMTADVDMIRHANENIKETAGKNITEEAGDDISVTAGKNMTESIGKNMDTSVGEKQTLSVGKDQMIDIGSNKDVTVGKIYSMEANDIKEEASSKMQLYSQSHEQKSDSTMKIDGGGQIDIKAGNVKINS